MRIYLSAHKGNLMTRAEAEAYLRNAVMAEREACARLSEDYAEAYRRGLPFYGPADKDAGRGRQEGHISAGASIAAAIRSRIAIG